MKKTIYYSLMALFMLVLGGFATSCSDEEPLDKNVYAITTTNIDVTAPNFDWMKDVQKIEEAIKVEFGDYRFSLEGDAKVCDAEAIKRFNDFMDKQTFTSNFDGVIVFSLSSKKGVIAEREFISPLKNYYTITKAEINVSAPNTDWKEDVKRIEASIKAEFGDAYFLLEGDAKECDAEAVRRFDALMNRQVITAKFDGIIKYSLSSKKGVISEHKFTNPITE